MGIRWEYQSRQETSRQVAERFAKACFDDDRQVDGFTFQGEWSAAGFRGSFSLIDGNRVYQMVADRIGNWVVFHD